MTYIDANTILEKDMQNQIEKLPGGVHHESIYEAALGTTEPTTKEMGDEKKKTVNRKTTRKSRTVWCNNCGEEFVSNQSATKFCGKKCKNDYWRFVGGKQRK